VLAALLDADADADAADAWLTPILTKKGHPAHTVQALTPEHRVAEVQNAMIGHISTIGVRETAVEKFALPAPGSRSRSSAARYGSRSPTRTKRSCGRRRIQ
jgi:uncharacterized protein (DUF111 family)